MTDSDPPTRARPRTLAALAVILPVGAFVMLEGASSLALWVRDVVTSPPILAEETSTRYDPEIGWVSKPSFVAPDMYGTGLALHTNRRGFRGQAETSDSLPADTKRLVCSGDSFTLGYGVADDDTWCARLATPRLQTVNMGQGGYGIDQAYLWYRRDARNLEHNVQVLAFITDDFKRMASDHFLDYGKPKLVIEGDSLAVRGVPVPPRPKASWISRVVPALGNLRTAELVGTLVPRRRGQRPGNPDSGARKGAKAATQVRDVMSKLVVALAQLNVAKGSRLVLVYLPVETDYKNDASRDWRDDIAGIADSSGVPFIDLIPALRQLTRTEVAALFIQKTDGKFDAAAGHFTPEGNAWAADRLRERLTALGLLDPTSPD